MSGRAMQEASLLVLAALCGGSQHGCGILTGVSEISGGRVKLRPGTLYTALDELRAAGLVEVDREELVAGRPHRYYRLTPRLTPASGHRPAVEPTAWHHPPPGPDLRIGDADREAALTALREHFAQDRLTLEELVGRVDAAFAATTLSQVVQTIRDLPQL